MVGLGVMVGPAMGSGFFAVSIAYYFTLLNIIGDGCNKCRLLRIGDRIFTNLRLRYFNMIFNTM